MIESSRNGGECFGFTCGRVLDRRVCICVEIGGRRRRSWGEEELEEVEVEEKQQAIKQTCKMLQADVLL